MVYVDADRQVFRRRTEQTPIEGVVMRKNSKAVIVISAQATLKRRLRRHLTSLGFQRAEDGTLRPPGTGKDAIRILHSPQRDDRLAVSQRFISERFPDLIQYFASGEDIDPSRISP